MDENTITISRKTLVENGIKRSGKEFFWIAGLSVLNSVALYFGSNFVIAIGLGITQIFDIVMASIVGAGKIIPIFFNLLTVGFFIFLGYKAVQLKRWAFVTGFVLYFLDTLIFIFAKDIIGSVLHIIFLLVILRGIKMFEEYKKIKDGPVSDNVQQPENLAAPKKRLFSSKTGIFIAVLFGLILIASTLNNQGISQYILFGVLLGFAGLLVYLHKKNKKSKPL